MKAEEVEKALREYGVSWVDKVTMYSKNHFLLEVRYHEVTFDELTTISEFFRTKKINIGTETREDGYCDTCRSTYTLTLLSVLDAKPGF